LFIFFYSNGLNTISARRSLWGDLRRWNSSCPWMVFGDFNSMLSSADKHNGVVISSYEISDFRECCFNLGSMMSTLLAVISVGQMAPFGANLIGCWSILHGLLAAFDSCSLWLFRCIYRSFSCSSLSGSVWAGEMKL